MTLIANTEVVAEGRLGIEGSQPLGGHVFVHRGTSERGGLSWIAITHNSNAGSDFHPRSAIRRIQADDPFVARMQ